MFAGGINPLKIGFLATILSVKIYFFQEYFTEADDGIEGCSQLMAHLGKEN